MQDINAMMGRMIGVEPINEVIYLHYQVAYLRNLLIFSLGCTTIPGHSLVECINDEVIKKCMDEAKDFVRERFPKAGVKFDDPIPPAESEIPPSTASD